MKEDFCPICYQETKKVKMQEEKTMQGNFIS